jgi:hypothetical protein
LLELGSTCALPDPFATGCGRFVIDCAAWVRVYVGSACKRAQAPVCEHAWDACKVLLRVSARLLTTVRCVCAADPRSPPCLHTSRPSLPPHTLAPSLPYRNRSCTVPPHQRSSLMLWRRRHAHRVAEDFPHRQKRRALHRRLILIIAIREFNRCMLRVTECILHISQKYWALCRKEVMQGYVQTQCVHACMCVLVGGVFARACARAYARACERACERLCVDACVGGWTVCALC